MKTITQFTLVQLKSARDLLAQHKPQIAKDTAPQAASSDGDADADAEAATASDAPVATAPVEAAPVKKPGSGKTPPAPPPSPEALAALGEALGLDEKKVGLLVAGLKVAGNRVDRVRQIRVVESEGAPAAAVKAGEEAYILDMLPEPARKGGRPDSGGKGGPGGKRRGPPGGRPGPGDKRGGPRGERGDRRPGGPGDARPMGAGKGPGAPRVGPAPGGGGPRKAT